MPGNEQKEACFLPAPFAARGQTYRANFAGVPAALASRMPEIVDDPAKFANTAAFKNAGKLLP